MELSKNNLEWWIDYVEEEHKFDVQSNVASLLEHSKVHQLIVDNLKTLKSTIESTKDDLMPQGEVYYMNQANNIMDQILDEPVPKKRSSVAKKINKFQAARLNLFL